MVLVKVYILLAVCDFARELVAGQLLPGLCWSATGSDWELPHAGGRAEAAAVGALEYAEYPSQRESDRELPCTNTDPCSRFLLVSLPALCSGLECVMSRQSCRVSLFNCVSYTLVHT